MSWPTVIFWIFIPGNQFTFEQNEMKRINNIIYSELITRLKIHFTITCFIKMHFLKT